jgi:hypothetical protein
VDLILRDSDFQKKKPLSQAYFSAETGLYGSAKNDFQLKLPYDKDVNKGDIITSYGTEWGGKIFTVDIDGNAMTVTGKTFRGQMELVIVNPFNVLTVSGTDEEVIRQLFGATTLNYAIKPTGRTVEKSVTIPVGSNLLKAVDLALSGFGETMDLRVFSGVKVYLNYASEHRYDYSKSQVLLSEGGMLPTAIHAIGKVNGAETPISVYLQSNGTVGDSRHYTGFYAYEIAEKVNDDCANLSELKQILSARLLALRSSKLASEVDIQIDNAQIGDTVNISILKYSRKTTQKIVAKSVEINSGRLTQKLISGG